MKKNIINKILILLVFLIPLSCNKQADEIDKPRLEEDIPKDWFDVEEFWSYAEGYTYTIFPENSDTIRIEMDWTPSLDTYGKRIEIKDGNNIIQQDMSFYSCGKIRYKMQRWKGVYRFLFGKFYYFDKNGNVTKMEDLEEDYFFTIEQVVAFLKDRNLNPTYIDRTSETSKKPLWDIMCKDPHYPNSYTRHIDIDGQTGIILKDTIIE